MRLIFFLKLTKNNLDRLMQCDLLWISHAGTYLYFAFTSSAALWKFSVVTLQNWALCREMGKNNPANKTNT